MANIYYWNGVVDPSGLQSEYHEVIQAILAGQFKHLRVEKLKHHEVYSARIKNTDRGNNSDRTVKSDRLLFTTIELHGKRQLMILEVVYNHDYHRSRFLQPNVLKNFTDKNAGALADQVISADTFELHENTEALTIHAGEIDQEIDFTQVEFYNQKFIQLSELQQQVAGRVIGLPLVIHGAPGSGKSCVAVSLLTQLAASASTENALPLLYVTESSLLVENIKQSLNAQPIPQGMTAESVQIKTFVELINTLHPETAAMTHVEKEHCIAFIRTKIKQHKDQVKASRTQGKLSSEFFDNVDAIYQELRIISCHATLESYLDIGKRQSLFEDNEEHKWMYEVFQSYQQTLIQQQAYHAPFFAINTEKPAYQAIIADESQDFSHLQLQTLYKLAASGQICFCIDNRQSLADNLGKSTFLRMIANNHDQTMNEVTLPVSHRCPVRISQMANAVSRVKALATNQGQAEMASSTDQTNIGRVYWPDTLSHADGSVLRDMGANTNFAVVTLEAYRAEARALFKTALVFTPETIKGLEYSHVLVYRILDADIYMAINKYLNGKNLHDEKSTQHRAKSGQANDQFGPPLNVVYTAVTRSSSFLYIIQSKDHHLANLISILSDNKYVSIESGPIVPDASPSSTEADWKNEAAKQLALGNTQIAEDIFKLRLNKTPADFSEFVTAVQRSRVPSTSAAEITAVSEQSANSAVNPSSLSRQDSDYQRNVEFLEQSLNNLTIKRLRQLIHTPERLFNYPLPSHGGICVFTALFRNQKTRDWLLANCYDAPFQAVAEHIIKNNLLNLLVQSDDSHPSIAYWLSQSLNGVLFLFSLIDSNPDSDITQSFLDTMFNRELMRIYSTEKGKQSIWESLKITHTKHLSPYMQGKGLKFRMILYYSKHITMIDATELADFIASIELRELKHNLSLAHLAVKTGNCEVLQQLIHRRFNINQADDFGKTPLHYAIDLRSLDMIKVLCSAPGIGIDAMDKRGLTPLFHACTQKAVDIVSELVARNANPNIPSNQGQFPLIYATLMDNVELVIALLHSEIIDLDIRDYEGNTTPLHIAISAGATNMIALLVDHGANINAKTNEGIPPATLAIQTDKKESLKELARYDHFDIDATDSNGETALHYAVEQGSLVFVKRLIKLGANVYCLSDAARTLLHFAAENGHEDIVNFLVQNTEIDVSALDVTGLTARDYAEMESHHTIAATLEKIEKDDKEVTEAYKMLFPSKSNQPALRDLMSATLFSPPPDNTPSSTEETVSAPAASSGL